MAPVTQIASLMPGETPLKRLVEIVNDCQVESLEILCHFPRRRYEKKVTPRGVFTLKVGCKRRSIVYAKDFREEESRDRPATNGQITVSTQGHS